MHLLQLFFSYASNVVLQPRKKYAHLHNTQVQLRIRGEAGYNIMEGCLRNSVTMLMM